MSEETIVKCPKCGWSRNVVRRDSRSWIEIFPTYVDGEQGEVPKVSKKGRFFCNDCRYEWSEVGQTFSESLKLVKIG